MRKAFIETLVEMAERDPRIVFLTADLGFMVVEPFRNRFPERFINVGVAEQNMIGIATGLAEAGFIPFVYSISNFSVLRPYEFIRNGPVLHQLPVRIVGVGGGLDYSNNGASHYGLDDIGTLRILPGMTILAPADASQVRPAMEASWALPGPVYYRLSKNGKELVPGLQGRFDLDQPAVIGDGKDLLFIALGNIATEVVEAVEMLSSQYGIDATVLVASCLAPVVPSVWKNHLEPFADVITVEAHYTTGGLGSLVSEIVAEYGLGCRVTRCGLRVLPDGTSGSLKYLYAKYELSADALVHTALNRRKSPVMVSKPGQIP